MGDKHKRVIKDVERAFSDAVRSAGVSASIRSGLGERIEAQAVGQQILTGTVTNYVSTQLKDRLCSRGYATTLTCQQAGDRNVDFVLDVNGKRVVIGVSVSF